MWQCWIFMESCYYAKMGIKWTFLLLLLNRVFWNCTSRKTLKTWYKWLSIFRKLFVVLKKGNRSFLSLELTLLNFFPFFSLGFNEENVPADRHEMWAQVSTLEFTRKIFVKSKMGSSKWVIFVPNIKLEFSEIVPAMKNLYNRQCWIFKKISYYAQNGVYGALLNSFLNLLARFSSNRASLQALIKINLKWLFQDFMDNSYFAPKWSKWGIFELKINTFKFFSRSVN